MHSAKRPLLRRLFIYDRELRAGHFPTADQLAELADVNAKTVSRDLGYLRVHYGAPAEFDRARNGWHYTQATYRLPAVLITEGELVAMYLANQVLHQYQGTPYEQDLKRAIQKLAELLPDEISIHWNAVEQAHSFRKTTTSLQEIDTFRRLADAVLHKRQLRITYWTASRDAETERTVDPYHLTCIDGEWYLVAYCYERKDKRIFAPARIRALSETGEGFSIPDDFRISEFFEGTFRVLRGDKRPLQTVRLRFTGLASKLIPEKIWHVSQRLQVENDGTAMVEFSLRSLAEVRRWILSWGSDCEVLEPITLRQEIAREAAVIASRTPAAANTVMLPPPKPTRTRQRRSKTG